MRTLVGIIVLGFVAVIVLGMMFQPDNSEGSQREPVPTSRATATATTAAPTSNLAFTATSSATATATPPVTPTVSATATEVPDPDRERQAIARDLTQARATATVTAIPTRTATVAPPTRTPRATSTPRATATARATSTPRATATPRQTLTPRATSEWIARSCDPFATFELAQQHYADHPAAQPYLDPDADGFASEVHFGMDAVVGIPSGGSAPVDTSGGGSGGGGGGGGGGGPVYTGYGGLDGVDYDCWDFATPAQAQAYFEADGGSVYNNVDALDRNNNGLACEPGEFD